MKDRKDDPYASWYGRVNITKEVRLAAAKLGVHPLVYAKSLDELLANNEAISKLIETPEHKRRLTSCAHEWVDATNKVIRSGKYCAKCGSLQ